MSLHREGYVSILIATLVFGGLAILSSRLITTQFAWLALIIYLLCFVCWFLVVWFFRVPSRKLTIDPKCIVAPADGKVVVIEEVEDTEFFNSHRLQISIFMSPINVHQNLNAVSGEVVYSQYHPGKYLVAWHPKSSTENERHSVVYKTANGDLLVKQIAGAVARRIVNYLKVGMEVTQTSEMGFIKFGSRVDLLLPLGAKPLVGINDKVIGGVTRIAEWPS